jgi:hypothetical protein
MKNKNRNNLFSNFRISLKYFPYSFVFISREQSRVFFAHKNNIVTNNNIVIN